MFDEYSGYWVDKSGHYHVTALASRARVKHNQQLSELHSKKNSEVEWGQCSKCNYEAELLHGMLPFHKRRSGPTCPGAFHPPA